jgi:hypothetical protein
VNFSREINFRRVWWNGMASQINPDYRSFFSLDPLESRAQCGFRKKSTFQNLVFKELRYQNLDNR